ncbi:hypothetical protein [Legionella santicrucis]|uniref:hypothetical protein n=1 Tax=Legionella santicrucis TaxID=45074 RepID=UPI0012EDD246|nr:hypothetical protein [Legionella santicrucis]
MQEKGHDSERYFVVVKSLSSKEKKTPLFVISHPILKTHAEEVAQNILKNRHPIEGKDYYLVKCHMPNEILSEFVIRKKDIVLMTVAEIQDNEQEIEITPVDTTQIAKNIMEDVGDEELIFIKNKNEIEVHYKKDSILHKKKIDLSLDDIKKLFPENEGFFLGYTTIKFSELPNGVKETLEKHGLPIKTVPLILSENEKNEFFRVNRAHNKNKIDLIVIVGKDNEKDNSHQNGIRKIQELCKQHNVTVHILGDGKNWIDFSDVCDLERANNLIIWGHGGIKIKNHTIDLFNTQKKTGELLQIMQDISGFKHAIITSCFAGIIPQSLLESKTKLLPGTSLMMPSSGDDFSFIRDNLNIISHTIELCGKRKKQSQEMSLIETTQCTIMSTPQTIVFSHIPMTVNQDQPSLQILSCTIRTPQKAQDEVMLDCMKLRFYLLAEFHEYINNLMDGNQAKAFENEFNLLGVEKNNRFEEDYKALMMDTKDKTYTNPLLLNYYEKQVLYNIAACLNHTVLDKHLKYLEHMGQNENKEKTSFFSLFFTPILGGKRDDIDKTATECLRALMKSRIGCFSENKKDDMINTLKVLCKYGADFSIKVENKAALEHLLEANQPELIYALLNYKINKNSAALYNEVFKHASTPLLKNILFNKDILLDLKKLSNENKEKIANIANESDWLKQAIIEGNIKAIKRLLLCKADVKRYESEHGNSLLHLARETQYENPKCYSTIKRMLVEYGVEPLKKFSGRDQYFQMQLRFTCRTTNLLNNNITDLTQEPSIIKDEKKDPSFSQNKNK